MAVLDRELHFSDAQDMTASSAAVTQSDNVRSLKTGLKDCWGGAKKPELGGMYFNVAVGAEIESASGACVVTAKLMSHTGAASIKSGTQLAEIALPVDAVAGTRRSVMLPYGTEVGSATTPHIGATFTVSGEACTDGDIDCWLGSEPVDVID